MLRQLLITGLVGLALVAISGRSTAFAPPAAAGSGGNLHLRGASTGGEDVTLLLRATRDYERYQHYSAFSGFGSYAAAGLALAGLVFCSSKRRSVNVSMGWRYRNKVYYGDGSDSETPKVPTWLQEDVCPPWLTEEKWEAFPNRIKTRRPRYFRMMFRNDGSTRVTKNSRFTIPQAVDTLWDMFDVGMDDDSPPWTIEVMMHMNLDAKYPDQQIRMGVKLPNGVGKTKRVAVFCKPDEEEEVLSMGAAIAGQTLLTAIEREEFDFDVLIAKPMSMPSLAKLGKILGPRRMMPSPKAGTVVQDYQKGIDEFAAGGSIELRNNELMMVACGVGSMALGKDKIVENIRGLLEEMAEKAPPGAKNKEIMWRRMFLSGTQAPSLQLSYKEFPDHRSEELRTQSEAEAKKMQLSGEIMR